MKNLIVLFIVLSMSLLVKTQVYKTVNITTAGTLSTILNDFEKSTITNLTVTGNVDARDIKCMRSLYLLIDLNLSETNIIAYTGVLGTGTFYSKPDKIISYPANGMPEYSFYNPGYPVKIQKISLPKNITSIGYWAFYQCQTLTSIIIPNNVTSIGNWAFFQCRNLTGDLIIPNSIRNIGSNAFTSCDKLTSITFVNSNPLSYFTSIGFEAFSQCTALKILTLSNSVNSIGESAFSSCRGLKTIYCFNPTPPEILNTPGYETFCFNGTIVSDVFVPTDAAVAAYKAANRVWIILFPGNIIKKGSISATPATLNNSVNVYSNQNGIVVEGVSIGESVKIYSVNGVCFQALKSQGERLVIPIARKALYIVKTSTKTFKIKI